MLKSLYYVTLLSLVLAQFTNLARSTAFDLYFFDVVVGIFSFLGLATFFLNGKFRIPQNLILFFIFSIFAFSSFLLNLHNYSSSEYLVAFFYLVRFILYLISGVVVYNMLHEKLISKNEFYYSLIFTGVVFCALGFLQLILIPDFELLDSSLGWDPHKNRLASTFFDPNFAGGFISLLLVLVMYRLKDMKLDNWKNLEETTNILVFLFFTVSLTLTYSRSSWAMFGIIILCFGFLKSRWLLLLSFLLLFLAYFAVPRIQTRISGITDPADSAHFRLISWGNTWKIISDHLLLGVGFNNFRYVQKGYGFFEAGTLGGNAGAGSDSSFLLVFATTGLLGLVVYLVAFFSPVFKSKALLLVLPSVLGLLVHSQFVNSLFYPQVMFVFFSILSLSDIEP